MNNQDENNFLVPTYFAFASLIAIFAIFILYFKFLRTDLNQQTNRGTLLSADVQNDESKLIQLCLPLQYDSDLSRFDQTMLQSLRNNSSVTAYQMADMGYENIQLLHTKRWYTMYIVKVNRVDALVYQINAKSCDTVLNMELKNEIERFVQDIKMQSKLSHPNLVQLIGFMCVHSILELNIMTEYMRNGNFGSIQSLVHQYSQQQQSAMFRYWIHNDTTKRTKYQLVHDVLSGLVYLHDIGVIYNNLQSKNIYFNDNWEAKLNRFEQSKFSEDDIGVAGIYGNYTLQDHTRIAPEALYGNRLTIMSDMFTFGKWMEELEEFNYTKHKVSDYDLNMDCPESIVMLVKTCLSELSTERPNASVILQELEVFYTNYSNL